MFYFPHAMVSILSQTIIMKLSLVKYLFLPILIAAGRKDKTAIDDHSMDEILPQINKSSQDISSAGNNITDLHRSLNGILSNHDLSIGADWNLLGDTLEGDESGGWFGNSVAMSKAGTRMAVGAYADNNLSGKVRIFDIINNSQVQVGNDIDGNRDVEDIFQYGRKVAMSENGSRVAIAAPGGSGGIVVYEWVYTNGLGNWNRIGSIVTVFWCFALAMSGDGNRFVVGSGLGSDNKGIAYVYEWDNDIANWVQVGEISGTYANENFACYGLGMSYDGKTFIGGSPYALNGNPDEGAGIARVYKEVDSNYWEQVGFDLELAYGIANDQFGYSVDMSKSGKQVVVGAPGNGGSAHVYTFINDKWKVIGDFENTGRFGYDTSISDDGKRIAVGVYSAPAGAYIFEEEKYGWYQVANYISGPYSFGRAVSLSSDGMTVAIGGPEVNSRTGIASAYASPYPLCQNSKFQMILHTINNDTVPISCDQIAGASKKNGFSCNKTGELASHCPNICGTCLEYQCTDSEASFLVLGKVRDCSWIKNMKPSKRATKCMKQKYADTCRETCNHCGIEK